ncbi:MAG: TonB-dependent receptor [Candidatus Zixiibacteriota bacterium]|jgi:outer membrane receptor protein involved in Fe transport
MLKKSVLVFVCFWTLGLAAAEEYPYYYALEPLPEDRYGGLETVTGSGYIPLTSGEYPGTVRVLDGEFLRNRGYLWLGRALAEEAGVYVEYVPGREGPVMVPRIRGGTGHGVLVLVDGVPLEDVATGWSDVQGVPVEAVARVEVITGPASCRFGDRAVAGVINVETMTGPREAARALLSASDGTYDSERYRFNFGMTARGFDLYGSGNRILTQEPNTRERNSSTNFDGRVGRRWENVGALDLAIGHFDAYENTLHPGEWEEVVYAPGLQDHSHDRFRLAGNRKWGNGELRGLAYYVLSKREFGDYLSGRYYRTKAHEGKVEVSYTLSHLEDSGLTFATAGGVRADAHSGERAIIMSGRVLEELRPAGPLYLAAGASYDALAEVGGALSPRLAVSAMVTEGLKAYGSFSGGVRLPSAAELGRREEILRERGYEAGLRFYRRGGAELGAAYFQSQGKDAYLEDAAEWTGELKRRGVEASAEGRLPPWFDWYGSYCFADVTRADGSEVGFVPRHRAYGKFGALKGFLKNDLTIRADVTAEYDKFRARADLAGGGSAAAPAPNYDMPDEYWTVGAHLSIAVVSFQLYYNVENINQTRDWGARPGYSYPGRIRTYVGFNWTLYD